MQRPTPRQLLAWTSAVATLLAVVFAVAWADRPPAPLPSDAPATAFSEARARPLAAELAERFPRRETGSTQARAVEALLRATLAQIPRVELAVHEAEGAAVDPLFPQNVVAFRVRDVLARLPGRDRAAVLLSAHYDSPPGSPGAADDGSGVAACVETLRALAAGPPLAHSVIANLNEGEETNLAGARAFLSHPWHADARAVLNLDAGGAAGRAVVLQSGPGNPWLLAAYQRAVPHPFANVLAQDLLETGALFGVVTDFTVYSRVGHVPGFDLTLYEDGWAYHTYLDRAGRLGRGSLQHLGETATTLARELAAGPTLPGDVEPRERRVYYDLLGRVLVLYRRPAAAVFALAALGLAAFAIARAARRYRLAPRELARATGAALSAPLAGLVAAVLLALVQAYALRRPHGWFARPTLALLAYGGAAFAASALVHGGWARRAIERGLRAPAQRVAAAWAGGTAAWCVVLLALTLARKGAAYLALWWVAPLALTLLALARGGDGAAAARDESAATGEPAARGEPAAPELPRGWPALALAAFVPGAVIGTQAAHTTFELAVPFAGRMPVTFPFDPILAVLVAVWAGGVALFAFAPLHSAGGFVRASGAGALVALAGLVGLAAVSPYTAARPKRVLVEHEDDGRGAARIVFRTQDYVDLAAALRPAFGAAGLRPLGESASRAFPYPLASYTMPAAPSGLDPVPFERLASVWDAAAGVRRVTVRLRPGGETRMQLQIPRAALAGWSLPTPLPPLPAAEAFYTIDVVGAPPEGWQVTLALRGEAPVTAQLARFDTRRSAALAQAVARLPPWVAPIAWVARTSTATL